MLPRLREGIWQWLAVLIAAPSVAGLVIAANYAGLFQLLEWVTYDHLMRLRPLEEPDPRVTIVTIDDADIEQVGQWPIPDQKLAQLLNVIKGYQPRVMGLHLYRPIPVQPGEQALVDVYKSTPNLLGVEKFVDNYRIGAPPLLSKKGQVAVSDLVLDGDGKLRRALIAIQAENEPVKFSLGAKLALQYLQQEGISYQEVATKRNWWHLDWDRQAVQLGKALFVRFQSNYGGYVRADSGGYQVLLNFRGTKENFHTVSMQELLTSQDEQQLRAILRDRIVVIGSVSQTFNTNFYTPYSSITAPQEGIFLTAPKQTAGVVIHANLASQIVSAALDERPLIRALDEPGEWLWILSWSFVGAAISWHCLQFNRLGNKVYSGRLVLGICLAAGSSLSFTYLAFLAGWWLPVVSPLVALVGAAIMVGGYHHQGLLRLVSFDGLTGVANRRYFDQHLQQQWWRLQREKKPLSLILCDVDYFKAFNDTYGHQAGDDCLEQVATAISRGIRPTDLVARYGGEEFVVVLPKADAQIAMQVAQRIRSQVKGLQIRNADSSVSPYVTLSCGIASTTTHQIYAPVELITHADKALYEAKKEGRDRVILQV